MDLFSKLEELLKGMQRSLDINVSTAFDYYSSRADEILKKSTGHEYDAIRTSYVMMLNAAKNRGMI